MLFVPELQRDKLPASSPQARPGRPFLASDRKTRNG